MKTTMKMEGLADLAKALNQMKTSTAKGVMRRTLKQAAQPMADLAEAKAPEGKTKRLKPSVSVSDWLTRRQKARHRKMFGSMKHAVEMYVGTGPLKHAHLQEFGTAHHAPQPFMRPAWDAEAVPTLARIGTIMGGEITKTAKRAAIRAARRAARAGGG